MCTLLFTRSLCLGFLVLLNFLVFSSQAQSTPPVWASVQRGHGPQSNQYIEPNRVAVGTDGSQFVSGTFDTSLTLGATTLTVPSNQKGVFLAKYNPDGTLAWARRGASNSTQTVRGTVSVDAAGNAFLTGYFADNITFGTTTLTTAAIFDIYVVKFDAQGNVLWAKAGSGGAISGAQSWNTATDAAGNVYLTGFFVGSMSFGGQSLSAGGNSSIFLCKLSSTGTVAWLQRAGSSSYNIATSLATDAAGNVYLTGAVDGNASFGTVGLPNPNGKYDLFVAKYDGQGNALWARRAGGANDDMGMSLTVDAAGNVAVAGYADDVFVNSTVQRTGYVVRYSSQGTLQWERKITPTVAGTYQSAAAFDNRGELYLTGHFQGTVTFGGTTLTAARPSVYVVRYNAQGDAVWATQVAGTNSVISQDVATDASGNAYFFGIMTGTAQFGSIVSTGTSADSFFLAQLAPGSVLTASHPATGPMPARLFPNPASGGLATLTGAAPNHPVHVLDALGRVVRTVVADAHGTLVLDGLMVGLYVVRTESHSIRLVVE